MRVKDVKKVRDNSYQVKVNEVYEIVVKAKNAVEAYKVVKTMIGI